MDLEKLRYPIGKFSEPTVISNKQLQDWTTVIQDFPNRLSKEIDSLTDDQLDTPYRPEGWTIRQVVHHCADSHMNAFTRFKLALTENRPIIKPYLEDKWAESSDYNMPVHPSLYMLQGIHSRWIHLINQLNENELERTYIHPENNHTTYTLKVMLGLYAWHCNHHYAHIHEAIKREAW